MIELFAKKTIIPNIEQEGDFFGVNGEVLFQNNLLNLPSIYLTNLGTTDFPAAINSTLIRMGKKHILRFKLSFNRPKAGIYNGNKMKVQIKSNAIIPNPIYAFDPSLLYSSDFFENDGSYEIVLDNIQGKYLVFQNFNSNFSIYDIELVSDIDYIKLDIDNSETVTFQKQLKDIRKPDKICGSFTKPFNIPIIDDNDDFFGYVSSNDSVGTFNSKNKIASVIAVDGINLLHGHIQLKKITTNSTGAKYFNIIFYGNEISFFEKLSKLKLNELDTSDSPIDNSITNIMNIVNTYENGKEAKADNQPYIFSLLERGEYHVSTNNRYALNQWKAVPSDKEIKGYCEDSFTPGLFNWYLFNKIHEEQGYTIDGEILNDDIFNQLVVPLTRKWEYNKNLQKENHVCNFEINFTDSSHSIIGTPQNYSSTTTIGSNIHNGDNMYSFQGLYSRFIPPTPVRSRFFGNIDIDFTLTPTGAYPDAEFETRMVFEVYAVQTYGYNGGNSEKILVYDSNGAHEDEEDAWFKQGENDFTIDLNTGLLKFFSKEQFGKDLTRYPYFELKYYVDKFRIPEDSTENLQLGARCSIDITAEGNIESTIENTNVLLTGGKTFTQPSLLIGGEITQMDYVKDIINLFNLYVNIDEENKNITYNTWEDFYEEELINITDKVVYNKNIEKTFINTLVTGISTYKLDTIEGEYHHEKYERLRGENPSEISFESGNDFLKSKTSIKNKSKFLFNVMHIFNYHNEFDIASASLADSTVDNQTFGDPGFTFLFYERESLVDMKLSMHRWDLWEPYTPYELDYYPVFKNSLDYLTKPFILSFGVPSYTFSIFTPKKYETFYTNYWSTYLLTTNSPNSFLLTIEVYLSVLDYYNIKMNSRLRIGNEIYFINKIKDWAVNKSTKIELIKITSSQVGKLVIDTSPSHVQQPSQELIPYDVFNSDKWNDSNSLNNVSNTTIAQSYYDSITVSHDITVRGGSANVVKSSDNITLIGTKNSTIKGSRNIEIRSADNVTVINTEGKVITESNVTYINGNKITPTGSVNENIINSGGEDSVQEDFTDAGIVDGGEDGIYKINWYETYKVEDGGEDRV